jgi:hypothetical protein
MLETPIASPESRAGLRFPGVRSIVRHATPQVVDGMVMPMVAFYIGLVFAGVWGGLIGAMVWSYIGVGRRMISGRMSGLILLAAVSVTVRMVVTALSGNVQIYFLGPAIGEAALGLAFLASSYRGVPLAERLAGDFVPFGTDAAEMRAAFRRLTLLWAAVFVVHAGIGIWMLYTESLQVYVAARTGVAIGVKALAVAASVLVFRASMRRQGVRIEFG